MIESYRFAELRISLSWKAEVYADERDHDRRASHLDDLAADQAISIMTGALTERGLWDGGPTGVDDPRWTEAVMTAYPRPAPQEPPKAA